MRPMILYLLLIPSVALYLYLKHIDKTRLSIVAKTLCIGMIFFTALQEAFSTQPSVYSIMIVAGLLMGLFGDVTICFSFIVGMLFFAVGHLCYIAAMLSISQNILSVPIFFIIYFFVYVAYKKSKLSLGNLFIPCVIYSYIITVMLSLAATLPLSIPKGGLIIFIGALLFAISDALLALINFGFFEINKSSIGNKTSTNTTKTKMDILSIYCYFIGQSLFAMSILI